jgi:hypothetical protein
MAAGGKSIDMLNIMALQNEFRGLDTDIIDF